jgi:hypothetical protein
MGDAALNLTFPTAAPGPGWPLRLAQQAFSALLEECRRHSSFRLGARRGSAREALSALSVDDRGPLEHWLALQLMTNEASIASNCLGALATVDPMLAAAVRVQLPRCVAQLERPSVHQKFEA